MSENYKVFVFGRGIVARHLSKRSAETILSMWGWKGFKGKTLPITQTKGN